MTNSFKKYINQIIEIKCTQKDISNKRKAKNSYIITSRKLKEKSNSIMINNKKLRRISSSIYCFKENITSNKNSNHKTKLEEIKSNKSLGLHSESRGRNSSRKQMFGRNSTSIILDKEKKEMSFIHKGSISQEIESINSNRVNQLSVKRTQFDINEDNSMIGSKKYNNGEIVSHIKEGGPKATIKESYNYDKRMIDSKLENKQLKTENKYNEYLQFDDKNDNKSEDELLYDIEDDSNITLKNEGIEVNEQNKLWISDRIENLNNVVEALQQEVKSKFELLEESFKQNLSTYFLNDLYIPREN